MTEKKFTRRGRVPAPANIPQDLSARIEEGDLGCMSAIADYFDVPLWIMFIPDLPKELLQDPHKERFAGLIKNYLACSPEDRVHAENIAAAYAARAPLASRTSQAAQEVEA